MNDSEEKKEKEKKAGSPLFILIIFLVLIGFIFYVPELYSKYNANIASFLGIGDNKDNTNKNSNSTKEISPMSAYYQIGSLATIEYNGMTIGNVSLNNGILSLDISSDEKINLEESEYYIEFYESKSVFIARRSLNDIISGTKTIKIDVSDLNITTSTYFVISHIAEDTIPRIELETDESGLGNLTCSKDNIEYDYTFNYNRLVRVKRKYTYTNANLEVYSEEMLRVQKIVNSYNELNGVTASIVENGSTFIYSLELDYETIKSYPKVDDDYIFNGDAEAGVIKFKMDAEGYKCI